MSKIVRTALAATSVAIAVGMAASAVQAQSVAMAGSYGEGNGIIVNIPQNPPNVACDPALAKCVGKRDLTPADLVTVSTTLGGTSMAPPALSVKPYLRDGPSFGVKGARNIDTVQAKCGGAHRANRKTDRVTGIGSHLKILIGDAAIKKRGSIKVG